MDLPTSLSIQELITIFSTIFSLGLLILYYFQYNISKEQAEISREQSEIMKKQQDIMKANQTPIIDIDRISTLSKLHNETPSDTIVLDLVNFGKGLAKKPGLSIEISVDDERYSGVENTVHMIRETDDIKSLKGHYPDLSAVLAPNGGHQTYSTPMMLLVEDSKNDEIIEDYHHKMLSNLLNHGVFKVNIKMKLIYLDVTDNTHKDTFLDFSINIKECVSNQKIENENIDTYDELMFSEVFINEITNVGVEMVEKDFSIRDDDFTNKKGEITDRVLQSALQDVELEDS